jgi:hypothetical protein
MRLAKTINLGAWIIIILNLLMAFGAIGIFSRMSPAIANIISKNDRSLQSGEEMLATLALVNNTAQSNKKLKKKFSLALSKAINNITELKEKETLDTIEQNYENAFAFSAEAHKNVVNAILKLSKINRQAMSRADKNARHLGQGGAWGIVFMATVVFIAGIIFIRKLNQSLLKPVEEIKNVLVAHQGGENRRRCTAPDLSADMKAVFNNLNSILDKSIQNTFDD